MSDTMKEYIAEAEKDLLHTYNRYQIVLDKGDGVYLYDIDGKKYLDFVAGIAVFALGYQNKAYNDALKAQIDKVIHTSNYYYNVRHRSSTKDQKSIRHGSGLFHQFRCGSGGGRHQGSQKIRLSERRLYRSRDHCHEPFFPRQNHGCSVRDGQS